MEEFAWHARYIFTNPFVRPNVRAPLVAVFSLASQLTNMSHSNIIKINMVEFEPWCPTYRPATEDWPSLWWERLPVVGGGDTEGYWIYSRVRSHAINVYTFTVRQYTVCYACVYVCIYGPYSLHYDRWVLHGMCMLYDDYCMYMFIHICVCFLWFTWMLSHRDIAAVQGSAPFFKKCVEKVRTSKKCPVCTRGFDSQSDIDKVITTVSTYHV